MLAFLHLSSAFQLADTPPHAAHPYQAIYVMVVLTVLGTISIIRRKRDSRAWMLVSLIGIMAAAVTYFAPIFLTDKSSAEARSYLLAGSLVITSVLGVINICWLWQQRQRAQANLAELAQKLGFTLQAVPSRMGIFSRPPIATGHYHGREVSFFAHQNPGEKNRPWIAVAANCTLPEGVALRACPNVFSMRAAEQTARMSNSWDGRRMVNGWSTRPKVWLKAPTDDPVFDKAFFVQTSNPDLVAKLLPAKVRNDLLTARQQEDLFPRLSIFNNEVRYSVAGKFSDLRLLGHLEAQMGFVCDFAEAVERFRA